ncbi:hyperosmotically inducible periplasmic protein [Burkholderia multivorans]
MKSDAALKQDVEEELFWDPTVDARQIAVAVHDRIVTLHGAVSSWAQKFAAQKAAQRVAGIRALVLELTVAASPGMRADRDLAAAIVTALRWQEGLHDQTIRVEVEHGCVTLDGVVDWGYQRHAAEALVSQMAGVVGVTNRITVMRAADGRRRRRADRGRAGAPRATRVVGDLGRRGGRRGDADRHRRFARGKTCRMRRGVVGQGRARGHRPADGRMSGGAFHSFDETRR